MKTKRTKTTRKAKLETAKDFDKVVADAKQEVKDTGLPVISQMVYKFHLNMNGQIFEGKGITALSALQALPVPQKITNKGVLTISIGDRTKEILLQVPRVKRLFYPNFQSVILKQLMYGI